MRLCWILLCVCMGTVAVGNGLRMLLQPFFSPGSVYVMFALDFDWFYDWLLLFIFGVLTFVFGVREFYLRVQSERCFRRLCESLEEGE